ncbi:MAG: DUF6735 family protein [Halobacteriales archaeon]
MVERSLLAVERDAGRYDLYGGCGSDQRLLAADRTMAELLAEHVDFLAHERLRVCGRGDTRTYRVLRFALPTGRGVIEGDGQVGRGALVSVSYRLDPEDDGYVRGWFAGLRETLGESVDRGTLTSRDAFDRLEESLRRFGADREVLFDPRRR